MPVTTFNWDVTTTGRVTKNGLIYTANTGGTWCDVDYVPFSGVEQRAFFQFDTSSIPDGATIQKVEGYAAESATQYITPPDAVYCYIGDIIGTTLNGTANEFNGVGGTNITTTDILSVANSWWDIGYPAGVDPTGTTDLMFYGAYSGGARQSRSWNTPKVKVQLRVTWSAVKRLPLLGVG